MPLIIPTPVPSQWAVNGVAEMNSSKVSPQIREQFHKTKLCLFQKKNKCALGASCPFAHAREELQPCPDLAKTKLCYNYFRHRCRDSRCKFAHGYQELRATNNVYKTELCRWWSYGGCKAGSACRYAHGMEELRRAQHVTEFGADYSEFAMPAEFGSLNGEDVSTMFGTTPAGLLHSGFCGESYESTLDAQQAQLLPVAAPLVSDPVCEDGTSDAGLSGNSEVSAFLGFMDNKIKRQQTAPASSHIPELLPVDVDEEGADEASGGNIVLRVKGTFMEAVRLDSDQPTIPMRRSWSDGDLPQLCEVMAGMEDFDDDCWDA